MSEIDRKSFDGSSIAEIIAEFPDGDEMPGQMIPVKKLSDAFDSCAKGEGNMKVYLRIRPISNKSNYESTITVESEQIIVTNAPESSKRAQYTKLEERKYEFSRVFAPNSSQSLVYSLAMSPLLDRFQRGQNCVFFAYGMTNSGKTHTIQGTSVDHGLLPRLVAEILDNMSGSKGWELTASVLEIYQEKIYDLIVKRTDKADRPEKLTIRDINGKVEVCKLSEHSIRTITDATKLMDIAATNRSKSTTLLNSGSSRSHAVYTLTLKRENLAQDVVFNVVDLAGAERSNRTKASIQQQKEANNINTSLMQLWRCLQSMKKKSSEGSNDKSSDIIPFRDSKLTHLLMPQLCRAGLSGVAMIACVNPQVDDYDETLSILGNASLASKITEISDLRRSAPSQSQSQIVADDQIKVAAVAANAITAATALGKRRRAEHVAAVQVEVPDKRTSKRCSAKTNAPTSSTNVPGGDLSLPRRTQPAKVVVEVAPDRSGQNSESAATGLKRMHAEIARLTEENNVLLSEQFTRETDIRIEVSLEMAKRSAHLLDQIQDLQYQLNDKESPIDNRNQSCKKIRRDQLDKANADMARDLEEAEEELERVKCDYEGQVSKLRNEKNALQTELAEWKRKIIGQQKKLMRSLSPVRSSVVKVLCDPISFHPPPIPHSESCGRPDVRSSAAICKEKISELECFDSSAANKGLASLRSPLGPVKNDTNSGANSGVKDHDLGSNWESPKGDGISPLRFDSSPKEMYRHKENLHAQLQQSFSASKGSQNSKNNLVASVEKCVAVSHVIKVQNSVMEAKVLPSVRANVVTARRVISTRITHQVPDALAAYEDANIGANPNAGNYINRLRTRNVR